VIGKDGRVTYRDLRFSATDEKAYERLEKAVQRAHHR
jgi:hypothetical protein